MNTFLFAKQFHFIDIHIPICMLSRFSCVLFFATQWTVAHQAPLSLGSSRQEYWSGWPCPPPRELPDPGIDLCLLCLLQAVSSRLWRRKGHPTPVLLPRKFLDPGAWWATLHGVAKSRTRLSDFTLHSALPGKPRYIRTFSQILNLTQSTP